MHWMPRKPTASQTFRNPVAREDDLLVEELDSELLIYDRKTDRAHSLGAAATRVWRACDGSRDPQAIATATGDDLETVNRALDLLRDCSLLDGQAPAAENGGGMTRRTLTFRAAAAAVSAPLIVSIAAPTAMAALTPTPEVCLSFTDTSCDACDRICGCCCCCQGGGSNVDPSCKLCYITSGCSTLSCNGPGGTGNLGNCSTVGGSTGGGDCTSAPANYTCKSDGRTIAVGSGARCCNYKGF